MKSEKKLKKNIEVLQKGIYKADKELKNQKRQLMELYISYEVNCEMCNDKVKKKYNIDNKVFFCSKNCMKNFDEKLEYFSDSFSDSLSSDSD